MGPSGAGKTTLLNALARRGPVTKGSISYGGRAWSKALKRRIAFVEQDDIVYPGLTVRQSVTFLARLRLPQDYNPSDYVMDLAVQGQLSDESVLAKLEEDFGKGSVEDSKQAARAGDGVDSKASRYTQPWMAQFKILVDREWTLTRPNLWSWQSFILYVGQALLSGILWFRLGFDEEDIFSRLTATFGIGIPWMFFPLLDALPLFPTSMVNLRKELGVGAYRLSAWYWCKTTVAMSNYLVWPILHVSVFYWMANLNPLAASYFALLGLILVSIVMYHSLGLLIAASTSPDKMMTVALLLVTFMFLFTGVFIPLDESALPFLGYINPVLYTFFAQV
eukprot:scaffold1307_cov200-Pinguiococcus_pyrenoidosus.AAC.134